MADWHQPETYFIERHSNIAKLSPALFLELIGRVKIAGAGYDDEKSRLARAKDNHLSLEL